MSTPNIVLNVNGIDAVLERIRHVFASLYNDRAISYRVHKGSRLTFSGTIRPAAPGTLMAVMRKSSTAAGGWAVAGGMTARTSNSSQSKYSKKIRITRSGTYAVYAGYADGKFVPAFGREIKIRVVR